MIPEPGYPDREVPVAETFHEQTDDELTKKEVQQIKADDHAIQIILMGLPEDIYAAVDSCETAQEIWLHPTTAMNMALVLMAKAFKLNYSTPTNNNHRISLNPRNRQIAQPSINLDQDRQMKMVGGHGGISLNSILGRMLEIRMGIMQYRMSRIRLFIMQFRIHVFRMLEIKIGLLLGIANQNVSQIRNGNVVAVRAKGNENGNNGDLDEIKEVNANCILMAKLQQASTSGTQTDNALVYDSNGSAEVPPKVVETNDLSNSVTLNLSPTTTEPKVMTNDKVIAPGMFRINSFKTSKEDKFMPINKVRASVRTNPITVSKPHVITKKHVNSD
nr:hypothetical protein [Tanacetum cinerariifolium]